MWVFDQAEAPHHARQDAYQHRRGDAKQTTRPSARAAMIVGEGPHAAGASCHRAVWV